MLGFKFNGYDIDFAIRKNLIVRIKQNSENLKPIFFGYAAGQEYLIKGTDLKFSINWYKHEHTDSILTIKTSEKQLKQVYRKYKEFGKLRVASRKTKDSTPPILSEINQKCIETNIFDFWKAIDKLGGVKGFGNRGFVFCGEPGVGKSLTMQYISEVGDSIYGKSTYNLGVSDLMKVIDGGQDFPGKDIIFVDDADSSLLADRKTHPNPYTSKLLSCLDGTRKQEGRVVIFSTNEKIDQIDPALRRSGRLKHLLVFNRPTNLEMDMYFSQYELDMSPDKFYGWSFADVADFFQGARVQDALYGTSQEHYYKDFVVDRDVLQKIESEYSEGYV